MKKKLIALSGFSVVLGSVFPLFAGAQVTASVCSGVATGNVSNIFDFLCKLQAILNAIIPFLIALGAVYFVWGVIQYVVASEEEAKKKGRNRMIYGIVGLVIIFCFWGLIKIIVTSLGAGPNVTPVGIPCVPGVGNC